MFQHPRTNKEFVLKLRNLFGISDATSIAEEMPTINHKWNIKNIYSETAQKILDFKQRRAKEWLSADTCKNKDGEVKKSARRDKMAFADNLEKEAKPLGTWTQYTRSPNDSGQHTDQSIHMRNKSTVPEDWSKGLIVKIPKKSNNKNCDNWRGISNLSIPSKVFCSVFLNRIEPAIDTRL